MKNASVWRADHVRESSDPLPEHRVDDVVVGAGITGLTTALLLARAGRDVCVVEASDVGALATGHTTAKVSLLQATTLSEIDGRHPRDVTAAYLEANREGLGWLQRFCEDHGVSTELRDAATFAAEESHLDSVRREHDVAASLGLPVRWVDALDAPVPAVGATVLADQVQLDPMELLGVLVEQTRAHGGRICIGRRVVGAGWRGPEVRLDDGEVVRGRTLTLATGTPILDRTVAFAGVTAQRSYLVAFDAPDDRVWPMAICPSPSWSVRDARGPDGEPLLLVGGGGHEVGRRTPTHRSVAEIVAWAREHLGVTDPRWQWSAQDYRTADGLPWVAELPGPASVHVATGFRKWGMSNGVAAARAVSGRILGAEPSWAAPLRRRRPSLSAAREVLTHNASVGWEMARGWVDVLESRSLTGREEERTVSRVCTHLGGIVRWNDAERSWDCPLHGSRFDADGAVIEGPATRPLSGRDA